MPTLRDDQGNWASFDDAGRLVGFRSRGVTWDLAAPSRGWALATAAGEVSAAAATTLTAGPATLSVRCDALRTADGAATPGGVLVDWRLRDGLLQATLGVEGLTVGLREVVLPDLTVAWTDAEETRLLLPRGLGYELKHAARDLFAGGDSVAFGTAEFQCYGWSEGGRGLYFDTRDPEGWVKQWRLARLGEGRLGLRGVCPVPAWATDAGAFAMPYPVSLGGFDGHWFDLATVYARWAREQHWAARGPGDRARSWWAEVACWLWNRGRAAHVVPPAVELARRLGATVGLDWYWWHQHGYDTEYPGYFPPRDGEEVFRRAVEELRASGVRTQVYTNGMAVDLDGAAWLPAGPDAVLRQADGQPWAHVFNVFTKHRLGLACGAAPAWHQAVSEFVGRARALGLDGLYLDMIGNAGGYVACWAEGHGHAPGGGCYGTQGFRALLRRIRAEQPDFPLSTEATQEQYLDLVEGQILLDPSAERWGWERRAGCSAEVVPLWSAVYHGRTIGFGNYAFLDGIPPYDELWPAEFRRDRAGERDWHAECPDQFAYEVARGVIWGLQPTVCNLTTEQLADPRLAGDLAYLLELARCHDRWRDHLLWGEMLHPGRLLCGRREVAFLQRYIFTPPGEERIKRLPQPTVLHSVWRAGDGSRLLVLTNPGRESADWELDRPGEAPRRGSLASREVVAMPLD